MMMENYETKSPVNKEVDDEAEELNALVFHEKTN